MVLAQNKDIILHTRYLFVSQVELLGAEQVVVGHVGGFVALQFLREGYRGSHKPGHI